MCGGGTNLVAVLAVLGCVLLAGCSGSGNHPGTETTSPPPAPVATITTEPAPPQSTPSIGDSCIGADIGRRATDANGTAMVCDHYAWVPDLGQQPRHPWAEEQRKWADCIRTHTEAQCRDMLNSGR